MRSRHYKRVTKFMIEAGQRVRDTPSEITEEERILRAKLIFEEVMETIEDGLGVRIRLFPLGVGVGDPENFTTITGANSENHDYDVVAPMDLVELADGCADIAVVTTGTLVAAGIPDIGLQDIIDESNLAKFDTSCPKCASPPPHGLEDGVEDNCPECGTAFTPPYRRDDGKWIKGSGWKAPDIQGWFDFIKKKFSNLS